MTDKLRKVKRKLSEIIKSPSLRNESFKLNSFILYIQQIFKHLFQPSCCELWKKQGNFVNFGNLQLKAGTTSTLKKKSHDLNNMCRTYGQYKQYKASEL